MSGNTTQNLVQAAYIVAAVLFVLSLAGLSKHEKVKEGNAFGVTGMVIALAATIWLAASRAENALVTVLLIAVAMAIGASIGLWRARVVGMTQMPELVAMLHSFVGLAAVPVGFNSLGSSSGADAPAAPTRSTSSRCSSGVHRRGDVHPFDRGLPEAERADQVLPADAAGAAPAQPRRTGRVGSAPRVVPAGARRVVCRGAPSC